MSTGDRRATESTPAVSHRSTESLLDELDDLAEMTRDCMDRQQSGSRCCCHDHLWDRLATVRFLLTIDPDPCSPREDTA